MKAKLIKTDKGNYVLVDPTKSVYDEGYMLGSSRESDVAKLSLKNCQAIEKGYDLDELIDEEFYKFDQEVRIVYRRQLRESLTNMFQKALELMGDKKFTEEDVRKAYRKGEYDACYVGAVSEKENNYIQSLQQTEWDVEIEEFTSDDLKSVSNDWDKLGKPKTDQNGELILKRV